jgi:hypothetical protein
MKKVIDYLITINWDYLPTEEVIRKLRENFNIKNREGEEAAEQLLNTVIFWEKHSEIYDSLEKILNEKFILV